MRGVEVFPTALARMASGDGESLHGMGQTSKVSRGGGCTGRRPQLGGSSKTNPVPMQVLGSSLTGVGMGTPWGTAETRCPLTEALSQL